jgi:translation initiation factor 1
MKRIDTSGGANPLANNPFSSLNATGLPAATGPAASATGAAQTTSKRKEPNRNRGRVDVVRQTAGRGGKTVTVVSGFKGIAERELEELARAIQRSAGVGGTLKAGGVIEIQGDQRDRACAVLEAAGFRPVRAGG